MKQGIVYIASGALGVSVRCEILSKGPRRYKVRILETGPAGRKKGEILHPIHSRVELRR